MCTGEEISRGYPLVCGGKAVSCIGDERRGGYVWVVVGVMTPLYCEGEEYINSEELGKST